MMEIKKNKKNFFVTSPDTPGTKNFWIKIEKNKWENDTFKVFDAFLDKKHSYVDIGAWVGPTVLYGCQLAKHCYAIEPDPVAFEILHNNIKLNPTIKDKITTYNICIGHISGKIKLGTKTQFGDSMSSILFSNSEKRLFVESVTFEEFVAKNKIKNCNFIKIDIEGGEAIILPTMKAYLQRNKPVLFLSLHPFWFRDRVNDSRKIIEVLKIYKNIFYRTGRSIKLNELFNVLISMDETENFSIIVTDRWNYFSRLVFRFKRPIPLRVKLWFKYYFSHPFQIHGLIRRKLAKS